MAEQEAPSPPSTSAAFSYLPSLSDNMEKFVSLIKRGDCTVSFVVLWCSFLPLISPQVESACSQVGVARSTFYRWQSVLDFSTKFAISFNRRMHRARDPDAPEEFKIFLAAGAT